MRSLALIRVHSFSFAILLFEDPPKGGFLKRSQLPADREWAEGKTANGRE